MSEPTDNELEDEKRKKRGDGSSDSGSASASSTFTRASGEGIVARSTESEEEIAAAKRKKRGEGEGKGEAGAVTSGFTRASGEGRIERLSTEKQKGVWADHKHLDFNEVVAAVAEFFSEFPARASANLSVAWDSGTKGGFAIINMAIKFGQDVAMAVRERTRESAVQVRRRYGINIRVRRGGVTVTAPNPQAGLN